MKILIDSADVEKIKEISKYREITGITTNPTILSKVEGDIKNILKELKKFTYGKYEIHIQTTESEVEGILSEARVLRKFFGETFYIKLCSREGIKVTATAILSPMQALAAAMNGASYVAPYVNRMENIGQGATETISIISDLLIDYQTEILAASFKNIKQIQEVLLQGAEAVTISPELIETSAWHPYTDKSVVDFEIDWKNKFGYKKIIDMI